MNLHNSSNTHLELKLGNDFSSENCRTPLSNHPISIRLISSPAILFGSSFTNIYFIFEEGTAVSTGNKIFRNSNSLEIPQPIEVEAKSNLSLMLKEEEQGEEVLALPSPGTLNDMMSKVQISLKCCVLLNYHLCC
uniref:Uncharacterized protein n=1 Tax=Wuchereria bancrofti TaxID=6293 RepID=A0A1I8EBL4_WUCBA